MKRIVLALLAISTMVASSIQAMSFFEEEEIENISDADEYNTPPMPQYQKPQKPLANQLDELESDSDSYNNYTDMEIE